MAFDPILTRFWWVAFSNSSFEPFDILTSWSLGDVAVFLTWWRHQIETYSALLAICAGNSPVSPVNSPHKGQWRGALMFFFDLRISTRLNKHSWGWWLETPSRPSWRHRNKLVIFKLISRLDILSISYEIALKRKPQDLTDDIGSGNGVGPPGNEPLPGPMLTLIYVAIWCHWATKS